MCTLAVAWNVFAETPVAVAANRDEALGRPSTPPRLREWGDRRVLAPRDEEAGGTWMGVNDAGVFVGITNRWVDLDGERSRGLLVRDCLEAASAADARDRVETALETHSYAGFNLVLADAADAYLVEWDGNLAVTTLDPGVHVVVNDPVDQAEKADFVEAELAGAADADDFFDRARRVLTDHDHDVCVHGDDYGTRSSALVAVHDAGGGADWWFADGPPGETPYERIDNQV
ncbi:NRDE family protein [Halocalculus aciditolerans]|uniref:NRDE family protein n=1 Tax=Halocalculus aciditolerans TaxID=1383812 RepID=A0A830F2T5_9EURY|nr:NRDE family protein [Halocalculus aciditolerans]GGL56972.1 hypothetical protein GCM10009039_13890 [Halocalculus aciditolerans]